jgi:serine/threonine-protein kinase RsbW
VGNPSWKTELLRLAFDRDAITGARHDVAGCAADAGLNGRRLDGFVLAVNEIMANAVRHGGGRGEIQLWRTAAGLICQIRDSGNGALAFRFNGYGLPPTSATGGRGLWLARRMCDSLEIESGGAGTTVLLRMSI